MVKHFGRIALSDILKQWSDGHPSNPRFLASEVAGTLRSLAPGTHPIGARDAGVYHDGQAQRDASIHITYGALADYFDSASTGHPAPTLSTSSGPLPSSNILIWQHWIDTIASEAEKRMGYVEALAIPANGSLSVALAANDSAPTTDHPAQSVQPSGSSPGYLKMHQTHLRNEGERSAAEQLDSERSLRIAAEQRVVTLFAKTRVVIEQNQHLIEENETQRRELSEERRARIEAENENIRMEEQLERVMGLAEFMDESNGLSPPDGRLIVECWCDVTRNGTTAPSIGWSKTVAKWFESRSIVLSDLKRRMFASALTGSSRKKGGAIATPNKNG